MPGKKIYDDPFVKRRAGEYHPESYSLAALMSEKIKLKDTIQQIQTHSDVNAITANDMLLDLGSRDMDAPTDIELHARGLKKLAESAYYDIELK